MSQVTGGSAVISVESLVQVIKHEAKLVPFVLSARPKVTSLESTIDVSLELRAAAAHVPSTIEETCRAIRRAVEERSGVGIRRLSVHLRNEPLPSNSPGGSPPALISLPVTAASASAGVASGNPGDERSGRSELPNV